MEMGGNDQITVGLEYENEGGNGRVKSRLVENEGNNLPISSSKLVTLSLQGRLKVKIPQSGDMSHPFFYLSKSLSGDGKILILGCDKISC